MTAEDAGRLREAAASIAEMRHRPEDGAMVIQISRHTWDTCLAVADALLGLLPAADAGERRFGPRYVVWVSSRQFCMCGTLAEALDWRAKIGGTVYEPLGMSAAEKVAAEPAIDGPAAGGGA